MLASLLFSSLLLLLLQVDHVSGPGLSLGSGVGVPNDGPALGLGLGVAGPSVGITGNEAHLRLDPPETVAADGMDVGAGGDSFPRGLPSLPSPHDSSSASGSASASAKCEWRHGLNVTGTQSEKMV